MLSGREQCVICSVPNERWSPPPPVGRAAHQSVVGPATTLNERPTLRNARFRGIRRLYHRFCTSVCCSATRKVKLFISSPRLLLLERDVGGYRPRVRPIRIFIPFFSSGRVTRSLAVESFDSYDFFATVWRDGLRAVRLRSSVSVTRNVSITHRGTADNAVERFALNK